MSIATMKKKTQAQYFPHSNGSNGFSLNGTHRNQGYVGQTMLSRSIPRTLMKGNTIRGHGGCCGKYYIGPVIQSAVISTEDPTIVKQSVMGTTGLINTKYRWIRRPQPFATVKPDNNQNINDQATRIALLNQQTIRNVNICNAGTDSNKNANSCTSVKPAPTCKPTCQNINSNNFNNSNNTMAITKQISDYAPISYSEYLLKLNNRLTANDIKFVPVSINRTPLPGNP